MEQRVSAWECWAAPAALSSPLAQLCPFSDTHIEEEQFRPRDVWHLHRANRGILNTPANISPKWQKWCFSYSSSRFAELSADLKLCSDSKQQDMLKQWKKKRKRQLEQSFQRMLRLSVLLG